MRGGTPARRSSDSPSPLTRAFSRKTIESAQIPACQAATIILLVLVLVLVLDFLGFDCEDEDDDEEEEIRAAREDFDRYEYQKTG